MKPILICPNERPEVQLLSRRQPLALAPALGQSLIEYWLTSLACSGIKELTVLSTDRTELMLEVLGDGARWGLSIELVSESRELTPAQAQLKYQTVSAPKASQDRISLLDHFPQLPQFPFFKSYAHWFKALRAWMPCAVTPDRVGMRQVRPSIWAGLHTQVSPTAQLRPPCWLGHYVCIGPGAVIGPGAIIENGCLVETRAEIVESYIGPDTFVGQCGELRNSLALGSLLINWQTGSAAEVPDAYVLCALRQGPRLKPAAWFQRLAESWARGKEESAGFWKDLLTPG